MGNIVNPAQNPTKPLAESHPSARSKYLPYIVLIALFIPSLIVTFLLQSAVFRPYDDEGYLIISLQQFLKGKALYSEVYTQYGPAYYLGGWLFYKILGLSVTNDTTRLLNIVGWSITAVAGSLIAYRLSRSFAAALLAYTLVLRVLFAARNEPGHPQVFCVVLIALAVLCMAFYQGGNRQAYLLFWTGVLGGLLAATKLNLGAYFILVGLLFIANGIRLPESPFYSALRGLINGGALLFPVLLMASLLSVLQIALYCGGLLVGIIGITLSMRQAARISIPIKHIGTAVIGFVLGILVPCLIAMAYGTSPKMLLYGLVLQHIGFDNVFPIPPFAFPVPVGLGIASALGIGGWLWYSRKSETIIPEGIYHRNRILSIAKFLLGVIGFVILFSDWDNLYPLIPILWLVLWDPNRHRNTVDEFALGRAFLCTMAIVETLWVFPVAGTHVAMAAVLPSVIVAICLAEGVESLLESVLGKSKMPKDSFLGGTAVCVLLFGYGYLLFRVGEKYWERVPLGLPGASTIRVWPEQRDAIVQATNYLREHSDTFVMVPGMNSFYIWTQMEPPTAFNAGTWMTLLTDEQQNAIIQSIANKKRVLVLMNTRMIKFWVGERSIKQEPLVQYIRENFQVIQQFGDYYILAPLETLKKS